MATASSKQRDAHRIDIDDERHEPLLASSPSDDTDTTTASANGQQRSRRRRPSTALSSLEALKKKKEDRSLFKDSGNDASSAPKAKSSITFARLLAQAKPERPLLILATVCLFLAALLNLALPAFVGTIIDSIGSDDDSRERDALYRMLANLIGSRDPRKILNASVVILVVIIVLASVFSTLRAYLFTVAGERVVARIRRRLFAHIIRFEVGFFDQAKTGELINRLSSDSTVLKDAATVNISMALRFSATVFVGIIYLFFISWKLTLVMLSVVPVVAISARMYGRKIRDLSKQTQTALAEATETAEESIANVRVVRSFSREIYTSALYSERIDITYMLGVKIALLYGIFIGLITLIGLAALILVLWYGATLVLNGEMTTGLLTSYCLYTITVSVSLAALSGLFAQFMSALGAVDRVFELLDRQSLIVDKPNDNDSKTFIGDLEFCDVRFSYPTRPEVEVLRGVTLSLTPGKTVALVGPSGQGKSTIVALIERFYDIEDDGQHGQILLDGLPIKTYSLTYLHRHIGLVSQDAVLFNVSIKENLLYGVRGDDESYVGDVSDEQIQQACEMANCWDFVQSFPEKLDTLVGERGVRLSGGQKQRITIARAILLNPRILICDEASSSLDAESEHHVQQALDRLMTGRTVLVIAHRLSTVKSANEIVVLSHGQVAERGSHPSLLAKQGIYSKLVARQLQGAMNELEQNGSAFEEAEQSLAQSQPLQALGSDSVVSPGHIGFDVLAAAAEPSGDPSANTARVSDDEEKEYPSAHSRHPRAIV